MTKRRPLMVVFFCLCERGKPFYNEQMKIETAIASGSASFKIKTIPFDKIPHQTRVFLDFQNNSGDLRAFYPGKNKSLKEYSEEVLANFKIDRNQLSDALREECACYGGEAKTLENIELLRDEKCVAVVTGQQAGLFSGPIFTIYKALSAIKQANNLRDRGMKAVPVFWIASEDHDIDEANRTSILGQDGEITTITNSPEDFNENTPVEFIRLGKDIDKAVRELMRNLPKTEFTREIEECLTELYNPDETYSSAFAKLILRLLGQFGLILVCPMNRGLRELCSPIFTAAIEKRMEINTALHKRNQELADAGYHSQVMVGEDFFPLFYLDENNQRNALRLDLDTNKIKSIHTDQVIEADELIEVAKKTPGRLSPNALMRSVLQDYLFPTVCYFGGSAEIAYFAQNQVIYEILDRPVTQFRHRASFTIIDRKGSRNLDRYELDFEQIFQHKEEILAEIIEEFISKDTAETFDQVERSVAEQLNLLEAQLSVSEPTLSDNLSNRRRKILWHLETLRKKFHRAETFKNEVLKRRIDYLTTSLYPENGLQERTMNIFYFLNHYGFNFIDWLYEAIDPDEREHQVMYL